MGNRPRKIYEKGEAAIRDSTVFSKNKSSANAKKIHTHIEKIEIDIWFDKHYHNRQQLGDDDGKREGIENDVVKELVEISVKHLIFYSLKLKNFSFVNFEDFNVARPLRIVLTQIIEEEISLNVIAEYHYINFTKYEVTITTAMRKNNFTFSDGQFKLEIDGNNSVLYKNELNRIKTISNFDSY